MSSVSSYAALVALIVSCVLHGQPGAAVTLRGDCGLCQEQYIQRLRDGYPLFADRVAEFLCPYEVKRRSDADMLIVASPGTTGTKSLASYLADGCGMIVHHWRLAIRPGAERSQKEGLLDAELEALTNESLSPAEIDAFFATDDLVGHILQPVTHASSTGRMAALEALLDDPVDRIFYDLYAHFPRAKFVLLERPAEDWFASRVINHPGSRSHVPVLRAPGSWHLDAFPESAAIAAYNAFQELVKCLVPPEQLAVLSYFGGGDNSTAELEAKVAAFLEGERRCVVLAAAGEGRPADDPLRWPPLPWT